MNKHLSRLKFSVAAFIAATLFIPTQAQTSKRFKQLAKQMPEEWYATAEAQAVADSVLNYQFPSGGWGKNVDWHLPAEGKVLKQKQEVWKQLASATGVGSTIDNGATTTEMMLLAKVYSYASKKNKKRYRAAFMRGLNYLLEAQYDNGGWPQFYPFKPYNKEGHPFYSNHITFNDNAIYNILKTLRSIYKNKAPFDGLQLQETEKQQAREAFDRGIECILNCQIRKNGVLTVWCQQHDEKTLAPTSARSFELASFTGSHETADILEMLMDVSKPSDRIVEAVTAAVKWLEQHVLRDMALEEFVNAEGKPDRRLVHHFGSNIWARYYDLETEEPFVCDRDGVPQPSLEYIGYERRNGYGWYGTTPQQIIDDFPKWLRKVRP